VHNLWQDNIEYSNSSDFFSRWIADWWMAIYGFPLEEKANAPDLHIDPIDLFIGLYGFRLSFWRLACGTVWANYCGELNYFVASSEAGREAGVSC
jgi:hypothetical protein